MYVAHGLADTAIALDCKPCVPMFTMFSVLSVQIMSSSARFIVRTLLQLSACTVASQVENDALTPNRIGLLACLALLE